MGEADPLVVGLDGGGTSTRCLVATTSGEIVSRGRAGGANPRSARDPGGDLGRALSEALDGIPAPHHPRDIATGVFGLAGAGESGRKQAEGLAGRAWHAAGLPGSPVVVTDVVVAFAGATPDPDGSVVIAGTGAVAARIQGWEIVRRCDGYGWLLGDEGSAVWIGRRAVQAALAALDGRGAPTVLAARVLPALEGAAAGPEDSTPTGRTGEPPDQAIIAAVYDGPPARLGVLSPVVEAAAREGDRVALGIVADAARLLLRSLDAVGPTDATLPVVLAGSLLTRPTLLAERVATALRGRPVVHCLDGAAGAAALALRAAAGPPPRTGQDEQVTAAHRRLLSR